MAHDLCAVLEIAFKPYHVSIQLCLTDVADASESVRLFDWLIWCQVTGDSPTVFIDSVETDSSFQDVLNDIRQGNLSATRRFEASHYQALGHPFRHGVAVLLENQTYSYASVSLHVTSPALSTTGCGVRLGWRGGRG